MSFFSAEKTGSGDKGTHLLFMVVPTPRTSFGLWFLISVLRGVPFPFVLILLVAVVAVVMIVVVGVASAGAIELLVLVIERFVLTVRILKRFSLIFLISEFLQLLLSSLNF